MKKTILAFALATAGLTMSGAAARADFCGDYANYMTGYANRANDTGCQIGAHTDWQGHANWCYRNPPDRVRGAMARIRDRFVQTCQRRGGGGGGGGYGGGGYGGGGGSGPGYCQNYAHGMVAIGAEAMRKGCTQYGPQGLHTNYGSHYNWCLRSPPGRVQSAAARINALLASCNR